MKIKFLLLFLFAATSVFSQSVLKGKVFNSDNEPLPGASVVISGSVIGTVTNEKGEFVLPNLKSDTYPLKISFVGYRPYLTKIAVVKDMVLNVTLQKDEVMTDEVFVYATRAGSKSPFVTDEISKEAIASKNMGQDIPYLLNMSPSFVATSDAGTGIGYTGFRIRGTDANRINVTINGIPLNDAESHAVYWVNMPDFSSSIENVQVQRGVGSSTFGAGAFGATVNMQTNSLRYEPYAQYNGAAGSFNSFKNSFEVGTGLINNHFSFDARLSAISSDGFIDRASSNLKSFYLSGGYYSDQTLIKFITFAGNEKTYQAWNGVPSVRLKSDMNGMLVYAEHGLYTTMETEEMIASNPRTYNLYTYDNETDNYTQNHYQLLLNQKFGDFFHLNAALHYTHGEGYYEQFKRNKKFSDYGMDNFTTKNDTIKRTDLIRQKWLDNDFMEVPLP
jgi:iron complex outermembrane recepter protein